MHLCDLLEKQQQYSSVAKSPFPAQTPSNGSSKSPFPAPTTLEPPSPSQPSKEATTRAKQKISWKLKLILGTLSLNPFDSTVMHITTPNIKGLFSSGRTVSGFSCGDHCYSCGNSESTECKKK
ncbi:hypothetical protein DY000_02033455 [Brassica cretica]|uniref:Uncharacterized protein n=1 Tax=Brassica cretica TaxID=69181 RepID=A0ABQ7DHM1_BRACR|nr:hypothetical protein DY000_02033455 [Brassica cretica]